MKDHEPLLQSASVTPATVVAPTTPPIPLSAPVAGHEHHRQGIRVVFPSPLETASSLFRMVVIALFVLTFLTQPFMIPSESMEPTLLVGDFVLVDRVSLAPPGIWHWLLPYRDVQRGDIVVFHFPSVPGEHVVKRVIGLPGEQVRISRKVVYINGVPLKSSWAYFDSHYPDAFRENFPSSDYNDSGVDSRWWLEMRREAKGGQLKVPADHYFVMGDNRNRSRDSRYWGYVERHQIVAQPLLIYFSMRTQPHGPDSLVPTEDGNSRGVDVIEQADEDQGADDRLGLGNGLIHFARWDRIFQRVQ